MLCRECTVEHCQNLNRPVLSSQCQGRRRRGFGRVKEELHFLSFTVEATRSYENGERDVQFSLEFGASLTEIRSSDQSAANESFTRGRKVRW